MRRCTDCGGTLEPRHGALTSRLAFIGPVTVHDVDYEQCSRCGDQLLPFETCRVLDRAEAQREAELIGRLPIAEFITADEARRILGLTRQAFHQNGWIRRGFIYSVQRPHGRRLYHRPSVELFRDTGDGRFHLSQERTEATEPERDVEILDLTDGANLAWVQESFPTGPCQLMTATLLRARTEETFACPTNR